LATRVTLTGLPEFPKNNPVVHFTWLFRLLGSVAGEDFLMTRGPDSLASRASSDPGEPTATARMQALLDHIRDLDKPMDQARAEKIANIKKALADGTYHVSAAEVARKILDAMQDP
jgi:anti-sigma28 factor (negative regulator of flagellin synthesis)